jgi:hypothetical protein
VTPDEINPTHQGLKQDGQCRHINAGRSLWLYLHGQISHCRPLTPELSRPAKRVRLE